MPVLRGAHGGLQDPPPHFLGNVGVPVELAERLLERVERAFRDREVVGILEALGVCMLEDRSQGDHRPAAHLFGPVAAAQDGEQRLTPYPFAERSLARRTPCDPKTLGRAARDHADAEPDFAVEAGLLALHWLAQGYGYEITGADVWAACAETMKAAARQGTVAKTRECVRTLVASETGAERFVTRILGRELGLV